MLLVAKLSSVYRTYVPTVQPSWKMIEGWWLPQEEGQVPPHHGHHGGPARQGGGHIHRGEYKKYRNIL